MINLVFPLVPIAQFSDDVGDFDFHVRFLKANNVILAACGRANAVDRRCVEIIQRLSSNSAHATLTEAQPDDSQQCTASGAYRSPSCRWEM